MSTAMQYVASVAPHTVHSVFPMLLPCHAGFLLGFLPWGDTRAKKHLQKKNGVTHVEAAFTAQN